MTNLITLLNGFNSDNAAYQAKLLLAMQSANNGKAPTVDAQGRFHAPCNGYEFNGSLYAAGEYMSDEFNKAGSMATAKVKITSALIDSIKSVWSAVSFGKAWQGQDGVTVCYAYFECLTASQAEALKASCVSSNKRKMMTVEDAQAQGLKHGASWKFNASKYAKALAYCLQAAELECANDGIASHEWSLNSKTYKTINYKLVSVTKITEISAGNFTVETQGDLTISGVTKRINQTFTVKITRKKAVFSGKTKIDMTVYGVKPPTALMGTIKTGKDVTVDFKVTYN
jgi:hypothetical protein